MKAVVVLALLGLSLFGGASLAQTLEPIHSQRPVAVAQADPGVAPEANAPAPPTGVRALRRALREKANAGLVGIVAGGIDGTYLRIATDLEAVLDGSEGGLRVRPVTGRGSMQNVTDVLFSRGIDLGIVQSDVLAYLKRNPPFPGVENFLQYITVLYGEEVHVLARKDIRSVRDLASKKVNFDVGGSGTAMTANIVMDALGVAVEPTNFDQSLALEKLKHGEISALVYVAGKPVRLFQGISPDDNLHLLPIPASENLMRTYMPAYLTATDYPALVAAGDRIGTLSVASVLATYNWHVGTERHRNVVRFVNAFFDHLPQLQEAPRHPKWQSIDLSASLSGWTRFAAAEEHLKGAKLSDRGTARYTGQPAADRAQSPIPFDPQQRVALFKDFVEYQKKQNEVSVAAALLDPARRERLFEDFVQYRSEWNRMAGSKEAAGVPQQIALAPQP